MCLHVCGSDVRIRSLSQSYSTLFFETKSLTGLAGFADEPQGIACCCLPNTGITDVHGMPGFYLDSGNSNLSFFNYLCSRYLSNGTISVAYKELL